MLSQGIVHLEGRPTDAFGTKAMAILTSTVYRKYRPGGGLKLLSGSVILGQGLTEQDFKDMSEAGVRLAPRSADAGSTSMKK